MEISSGSSLGRGNYRRRARFRLIDLLATCELVKLNGAHTVILVCSIILSRRSVKIRVSSGQLSGVGLIEFNVVLRLAIRAKRALVREGKAIPLLQLNWPPPEAGRALTRI